EVEFLDQTLEAVVEQPNVVAFAQHTGDFTHLDARRNQVDLPTLGDDQHLTGNVTVEVGGHVNRRFFDFALAPQVIVERILNIVFVQAIQHVNSRRLDVRIDHADTHPPAGEQSRKICRRVRFARTTPEGVYRNDLRHH